LKDNRSIKQIEEYNYIFKKIIARAKRNLLFVFFCI